MDCAMQNTSLFWGNGLKKCRFTPQVLSKFGRRRQIFLRARILLNRSFAIYFTEFVCASLRLVYPAYRTEPLLRLGF
jgi:hypothetical protein